VVETSEGRELTDESLRAERGKTDRELSKRREVVDESADDVVLKARRVADQLLQTARDTADEKGEETRTAAVIEERTTADDSLRSERSAADESIRKEREERRRALLDLLRLEREETDQHLLTERGSSDEALNTRDIFLAMVSHDLRTLLGGIAMNAEMLAREAGQPAAATTGVVSRTANIQRLTARMNRLIGDLVDVASIEAGKFQMTPTDGDLRTLVHQSVEIFQASADARGIRLEEVGGPALPARFDHDRLLQVVANLIGNAIKFCSSGADISVRTEAGSGEARVAVSDTGPGIRAENLEAIFGRFWQIGRHDRRGLGLGLYISRCIVEAHGGRIWAENRPAGGSTFFFTVPTA